MPRRILPVSAESDFVLSLVSVGKYLAALFRQHNGVVYSLKKRVAEFRFKLLYLKRDSGLGVTENGTCFREAA